MINQWKRSLQISALHFTMVLKFKVATEKTSTEIENLQKYPVSDIDLRYTISKRRKKKLFKILKFKRKLCKEHCLCVSLSDSVGS